MGYYNYWSKYNTVTKPGFVGNWWRTWWKTNKLFGKKKTWALANYNKKKYRYLSKWRRTKYMNNYFYYRFDCHLFLEIPEIDRSIYFKTTDNNVVGGDSSGQPFKFRPLQLFLNASDSDTYSKWEYLKQMFKYMKCNGISIKYTPYAITAPEETFGDQKPNLLMFILLQSELNDFKDPATVPSWTDNGYYRGINSLKDSPYARVFSFDDTFRFYRPFPYKKVDYLAEDAQMFYQYINIDVNASYYPNLIVGLYPTQALPSLPQNTKLKFGDLDISMYFTFKTNIV